MFWKNLSYLACLSVVKNWKTKNIPNFFSDAVSKNFFYFINLENLSLIKEAQA